MWNENKGTEFAPSDVVIAVNKDLAQHKQGMSVEFLKNYKTSNALTEDMLDYMEETESDADETARWWMKENEDISNEMGFG